MSLPLHKISNMNIAKNALLLGALFALSSVVIGAFGAHYLKTIFSPEILTSFETGVRYQFYHAVALLFFGLYTKENGMYQKFIFWFFTIGIVLFSGSIYLLCFLKGTLHIGLGGLGILTPIGGMFFIIAWALLVLSILKKK